MACQPCTRSTDVNILYSAPLHRRLHIRTIPPAVQHCKRRYRELTSHLPCPLGRPGNFAQEPLSRQIKPRGPDAIGKFRSGAMTGAVGSPDEREQTQNRWLGEMDGFARQMIMGCGMSDRLRN
jgi:hypothetical protein